MGKKVFLILNKADLLPLEIRKIVSEELNLLKIDHIFVSAKNEQEKLDKDIQDELSTVEISTNTSDLINKNQLF